LKEEKGGSVNFGDNASGRIVGKVFSSLDNGNTKTHNVLYVENIPRPNPNANVIQVYLS
jgi:hypothetical protein